MCGIAGYWGEGSREILQNMGDSLTHRGPDAGGIAELGVVGFAHRRLSILDLTPTGHQPMHIADGSISLIFNGEIYNYKELKKEFLSAYTFKGSSDTEVLLYLYQELGESFLKKIKGMFALALYDAHKGTLLLARDHLGKKPLYWTKKNNTLIFGSELKALRTHPLCPHLISRTSIAQYLVYEYIPAPATIYEDVSKLSPGTYLQYDGTHVTQSIFSEITPAHGTSTKDFSLAKNELHGLLDRAVMKRMVADVSVGVFLSGGLDSSAVTYFAQKAAEHQVKTFSIGFQDTSFDESHYAREVAKFLGTQHHERIVGTEDLLRVMHQLPLVLDEPMADSSIIPTLLLSEFTRSEVKVALGGDGADELFWGYDTFFAHRLGMYYEKIPSLIQSGIQSVVNALPVSHQYMSFDFKAKKFLSGFSTTRARRNTYWLSAFTPKELSSILNYEIEESSVLAPSDSIYTDDSHFWNNLQDDYLKGYLAEEILVKTDRASMAYGLEVRAPFLDLDVVNFAMTLNPYDKYRGRSGKYILKQAMKGCLPDYILERPKKGFGIPIGSWIKNELKELFETVILDGALVKSGLFKRSGLAILFESHISGKVDNRKKLWALFVLALWMEKWA